MLVRLVSLVRLGRLVKLISGEEVVVSTGDVTSNSGEKKPLKVEGSSMYFSRDLSS